MTSKNKSMWLSIQTETRSMQFSLSKAPPLEDFQSTNQTALTISNTTTPPQCNLNGQNLPIKQREAEMIDRLLDVCAQYSDQGDPHLSAIVDRIGMTLMQVFMERAQNTTKA